MASASTPSANEPAKDLILALTVQLKPMIKAQISEEWYLEISGRMVSSGIIDVAFASVYLEKIRLKKLMMMKMIINIIIIVMNKLQKMMVFSGRHKLTYTMKLRPEK